MKPIASLLVFSLVIGLALTNKQWFYSRPLPSYIRDSIVGCFFEDTVIVVNKSIYPINRKGRCERLFCTEDLLIEREYCGRHNLQQNDTCTVESDISKPYPECCPQLVCHETY